MDSDLHSVDRLLKALADPTRLRIVALLRSGEVCVCHLHDSLKISQPKVSRHLAYLRRAGVVQTEKRGLWVYYRLADQQSKLTQTILEAAGHCVTHAKTARSDAKRLETKTGCCAPEQAGGTAFACCAT